MSPLESESPAGAPARRDARLRAWVLAYLRHAPVALCIRELNRLLALEALCPAGPGCARSPVLDVGCGDGFWWTLYRAPSQEVYGADVSPSEVRQARRRIEAAVIDVSRDVPFPAVKFQEVIGNCSLEHVRDIDAALRNLRRCAADGARLILFVPAPGWAYHGLVQGVLLRHFPRLAMMVSGAINGFFQHWHLYAVPVWKAIIESNGWKVAQVHGLGGARSEFLHRLFLPVALPGFLVKSLCGVYPNRLLRWVPDGLLAPLSGLVEWALQVPLVPADDPKAYEYMFIAEPEPLT
jgi:SAM-dependent methyltransferase